MLTFHCLSFNDLTTDQLYAILQLRQEVFIVEQDCPYLDADGKDQQSFHVIGLDQNDKLQAYARIVPKGVSYPNYTSIGRVITSSEMRGQRQGKPLMKFAINNCLNLWPEESIKISAQTYIVNFYKDLGFEEVGKPYLEDDIPHIGMIKKRQ